MADDTAHESWTTWFERNGPRLLACARLWSRSHADAEDLVQMAFVRFWNRQRCLGGNAIALLLTSIRRAALDLARSEQRRQRREQASELCFREEESWFESEPGDDRTALLEAALRRLPAEQREVLVLKIWGELSFDEISSQLGIPANTAASRYRYALLGLKKELQPVS